MRVCLMCTLERLNEIHVSQVRCTQYWPDNVEFTEKFAYISVTLTRSITHADYTIIETLKYKQLV